MKRTIINSLLATTMLVSTISPAISAVITQDSPTLVEINAGVQSGDKFQAYPVAGNNAAPVGFIFNDVLNEGVALPQIKNPGAVLEALESSENVLIASNSNIIVLPKVYQVIAEQNGIDEYDFFRYLAQGIGMTDEQFNEMVKKQTQAIINVLGVKDSPAVVAGLTITKEVFITLPPEVQTVVQTIIDTAEIDAANEVIAQLTQENASLVANVANLNLRIAGLNDARILDAAFIDQQATTIYDLRADIEDLNDQILNLTIRAVSAELNRDQYRDAASRADVKVRDLQARVNAAELTAENLRIQLALSGSTITPITTAPDAPAVAPVFERFGIAATGYDIAYENLLAVVAPSSVSLLITELRRAADAGFTEGYNQGYEEGYVAGYNQAVTDSNQ